MKITIIGAAGCIGSCAAFHIAAQGLADEIVMVGGRRQYTMKQHALDISTAVAAKDVLVRAGDYEDMTGSDIVLNSAGAPQGHISSRIELLPRNIGLISDIALKIKQYCPEAVVITLANPVGPLNYATYLLSAHRDLTKFIGYSTNDSIRFRIMAAEALGVKTSRVEATVIGEHGATQVLLFSSIRVDGKPVTVTEDIKQNILAQTANILQTLEELKAKSGEEGSPERTAGWTCAVGLGEICRAIVQDTKEMIPCSAVLDGEYGCHNLSMSAPVILGKGGIQDILEWKLPPDEQEGLKITAATLTEAMHYVEQELGLN
ncbi:malate dehydrogenase [Chloroflexota bacterium]